jgi:Tfp pilus assembly protein PilO
LQRGSWLVTSALAGGGLLYLFCSFVPAGHAIRALRDEIRSRQRFGAQSPTLMSSALAIQKQLDRTKSFVADNERELPTAPQVPELSGEITRAADLAGVRTTHFQPLAPKQMAGLDLVPMELSVSGRFSQIAAFLGRLDSLKTRVWMDDVKIERAREDGKDEQCVLKFSIFALNSEKSD